jgi:hypothetical protein
MVITQHRFFLLNKGSFIKKGLVEEVRENLHLEYRFPEKPGKQSICVFERGAGEGAKPIHEVMFRSEDFPETAVSLLASALYGARDEPHAGLDATVSRPDTDRSA